MSRNSTGSSREEPKSPDGAKTDFVVTPGGPVRRENVHPVEPGGAVVRRDDGSFEVVPPAPAAPSPAPREPRQG